MDRLFGIVFGVAAAVVACADAWLGYVAMKEPGSSRVGLRSLLLVEGFAMTFALLYAVSYGLAFDFVEVTWTHCSLQGYVNLFPSISSAISCCDASNRIWKLAVSFHAVVRIGVLVRRRSTHRVHFHGLHAVAYLSEIASLVILSFIPSRTSKPIHQTAFAFFVASSVVNLQNTARTSAALSKVRLQLFKANVTCAALSVCFYALHNAKCFSNSYTLFGLCETAFVLTNVAYHLVEAREFS